MKFKQKNKSCKRKSQGSKEMLTIDTVIMGLVKHQKRNIVASAEYYKVYD